MTKNTSALTAWVVRLAIVPVAAVALLLFCNKTIAAPNLTPNKATKISKTLVTTQTPAQKPTPKSGKIVFTKNKVGRIQPKADILLFPPPVGKNASGSGGKNPDEMLEMLSHFYGGGKYAANDAPAEVMDAYQAIMKKYDLKLVAGKGKLADISSADTAQLHKLYSQMSRKQQGPQYVKFIGPEKPLPKKAVTDDQLKLFRDPIHGIWIDGKKVENAALDNYTAKDFANVFGSKVHKNARKKYNHHYQINLTTNRAYDNEYKRIMAKDQSEKMVHIQARQSTKGRGWILHNSNI